jgi:hypothetical protein
LDHRQRPASGDFVLLQESSAPKSGASVLICWITARGRHPEI